MLHDVHASPLAFGWDKLVDAMRTKGRFHDGEVELVRLAYFVGASTAVRAACRSTMALLLMSSELREFENEVMGNDHGTEQGAQSPGDTGPGSEAAA